MKFLTRILRFGLLSTTFMLLISCGGSSNPSIPPSIETIQWQLDENGFIQFSTNDPQYYQHTFWHTIMETTETPMTTVTAFVKKESGPFNSGCGIVFCYLDQDNFYRLFITPSGYYTVSKKAGGLPSDIIPWVTSTRISTGLGVENQISVSQTSPFHFSVSFNGTEVTRFTDYSFQGGRAGFIASVSSAAHENFPYTPEDFRFKLILPVPYP